MPPPETFERNADVVVWPKVGDTIAGEPELDEPVELEVRWERTKRDARRADGTIINLDASLVLDQEVAVGSIVWIGTLADWYGSGSAAMLSQRADLYRVETYEEVPDVKGREVRREAGLRKHRGTLQ